MPNDLDTAVDRVTFRDGQLLAANDLRDDHWHDALLRRLHVHTHHQTWGIGFGFTVQMADDNRAVVVGPGHALDAAGQDILLSESIRVSVPRVIGPRTFVLALSYQTDAAFHARRDLSTLCLRGLGPWHERPNFVWRRPEELRFGPEVPLVQVIVAHSAVQGELDRRVRRNARRLMRPRIGRGTTEPGRSGWRLWEGPGAGVLGLELPVDTSEAGFTDIACYFATLRGDFTGLDFLQLNTWTEESDPLFAADAFSFVVDARPAGFTYRVTQPKPPVPTDAEQRHWTVSWFGVQPLAAGEPAADPAGIFPLSSFPTL